MEHIREDEMAEVAEAGIGELQGQEEIVSATPAATAKIRELRDKEGLESKGLRVRVVGGGCHGFSYALGFDDRKESDTVQSIDGVDFLIDRFSGPYLMGAGIDYLDGLSGAGFKIGNPNAKSTCGCGESFGA
jgi:iron-sulfur cluster assembly accessory protein